MPTISNDNSLLREEIKLTRSINDLEEEDKISLKKLVENYFEGLSNAGIKDIGLAQPFQFNWVNTLLLIVGFVPFLIGGLINVLPILLGKKVADDKVKRLEFHSSIRFGVSIGVYTLIMIEHPYQW